MKTVTSLRRYGGHFRWVSVDFQFRTTSHFIHNPLPGKQCRGACLRKRFELGNERWTPTNVGWREKLLILVPFVFGAVSAASTSNAYVAFATSARHSLPASADQPSKEMLWRSIWEARLILAPRLWRTGLCQWLRFCTLRQYVSHRK